MKKRNRDYDFSSLPSDVVKDLTAYPNFVGYEFKEGILYACVKINDIFYSLMPVYDENKYKG